VRRHASGLPDTLLRRPVGLLRPRDARDVYRSNPAAELARLQARGLLRRVATGYYVVVPPEHVGDPHWRPALAATAWAIAAVDYGVDAVAVCGPSAARHHGLIPRELAAAFVAVPKQRPALNLLGGQARYVRRAVDRLDVERWSSELGQGWVTTIEQTALDLQAHRSDWMLADSDLEDVLTTAAARIDIDLLGELAASQRLVRTAERVLSRRAEG
jgi:predicted transcriptional regulator of viral defense system